MTQGQTNVTAVSGGRNLKCAGPFCIDKDTYKILDVPTQPAQVGRFHFISREYLRAKS